MAETTGGEWFDGPPRMGYGRSSELVVAGGQVVLELLFGGHHEWPHVRATGSAADDAAAMIRAAFPEHLVARADVCEDLLAPEWFDRAFGVMIDVARDRGVRPYRQGDWDSDRPARTLYLGSPSSAVRVRMYEKGRQLIQEYGQAAADVVSEDWTRVEVQVRPAKRDHKLAMARVPAAEWWGCSGFSKDLADKLLGVEAPRLAVGAVWKGVQDLERREFNLVNQYGGLLDGLYDQEGSWQAVGTRLGRLRDRMKGRASERNG